MKKTLFITKYFPPMIGGSIRWYEEVYKRYPVGKAFILTQEYDSYQSFDSKYPAPVIRTKEWGHPSIHPKFLDKYKMIYRAGKKVITNQHIELLHADNAIPAGLVASFLSKKFKMNYILYAHGEEIVLYSRFFPEKYVSPYVYKHAKAVIANSSFTVGLLKNIGVKEKNIHLIHPGVDTEQFRPGLNTSELKNKYNLSNKKIIVTISRLQERKGQDYVIRAMPLVLKDIPNTHYLIVGDGEERERLEKLVRDLSLEDKVTFVGFVSEKELPYYYNLADVFILANRVTSTSDVEGFGMVFIEANACEKPVIGGKTGGAIDAIVEGKTGLFVNPTNEKDIANKIIYLLKNPDKATHMGKYGRDRAVKEFGWDHIAKRIQELG